MNRRQLLKGLGAGAVLTVAGTSFWLTREHNHPELSVSQTLDMLNHLDASALSTPNPWGLDRTFHHLAQSIEFSMTGYPQMKSETFQNTIGSLAFRVFNARGRMQHGLSEEIPGEVVVDAAATSSTQSLARLISSLEAFAAFTGPLKPHFAYGELSRNQYALAHVMHINNHFEQIVIRG